MTREEILLSLRASIDKHGVHEAAANLIEHQSQQLTEWEEIGKTQEEIVQLRAKVAELVEVNQTISSDRAHFEHAFRLSLEAIKRLTGGRNEAQVKVEQQAREIEQSRLSYNHIKSEWDAALKQLTTAKAENERLRKALSEVKCYCCGELAVRM